MLGFQVLLFVAVGDFCIAQLAIGFVVCGSDEGLAFVIFFFRHAGVFVLLITHSIYKQVGQMFPNWKKSATTFTI